MAWYSTLSNVLLGRQEKKTSPGGDQRNEQTLPRLVHEARDIRIECIEAMSKYWCPAFADIQTVMHKQSGCGKFPTCK